MSWHRGYCTLIKTGRNTFGVGIVTDKGEVLANERSTYQPKLGSGIIPNEARDHHEKMAEVVLKNALDKAKLTPDEIDIVSYSAGPGIPPILVFTADFATNLAEKYKKPIVPVNHCCAHLEIGRLTTRTEDPVYLYLSGGNTQVIAFTGGRYRIFGETQDTPVGNAIDTLAREIGLPPPYGPNFDKIASEGKWIGLPYVNKGMDVSFSGLLTQAIKKFKEGMKKEDICYSFQETCFAMLTEVTERALAHTGKREVLLVGGVAASKRLQNMVEIMCKERGAKSFIVPHEYSGDQGAMIAWNGILAHKSKWKPDFKDKIKPKWRTDSVDVTWLND